MIDFGDIEEGMLLYLAGEKHDIVCVTEKEKNMFSYFALKNPIFLFTKRKPNMELQKNVMDVRESPGTMKNSIRQIFEEFSKELRKHQ